MKSYRKTFGIIIIGNEILSGKTIDTNSNLVCRKLTSLGLSCKQVVVIPDDENIIIEKVNHFREEFDFVFTTGGIGPTHDDITANSVSKAFSVPLILNKVAKKRLEKHYSDEPLTQARLKMAYLPTSANLIDNPVSIAPGFFLENVYVLPGVPKILEAMLDQLTKKFSKNKKFENKTITTILSEGIIGDYIANIQKKYSSIEIGSYPYFKKNSFGVSLVVTGDDKKSVDEVVNIIFAYLKKKKVNLDYFNFSLSLFFA